MDFRFYGAVFLRRLPLILLVWIVVASLGILIALRLPTVYAATSTLVVESGQIPDNLAASTVRTQASEQLQIIQQRLMTRKALLDMAKRLQIYAAVHEPAAEKMTDDQRIADLRKRILFDVTNSAGQAILVTIGFSAPDADLAAAVTNDLVAQIQSSDAQTRTSSARQTLDFFTQEAARLNADLAKRSDAILAFTLAHTNALPDSLEFHRTEEIAASVRLAELAAAQDDLLTRRTRLMRLHTAAQPRSKPAVKDAAPSAYDVQLADLDAQLDQLTQEQARIRSEQTARQAIIAATPGNALALAALQRDYDTVKAESDLAMANESRAKTGDAIESMAKGQSISVIEPARAPTTAARPNRKLIAMGSMIGGLLLGLGLVGLSEVTHSGIRRPIEITSRLGIAVFATVPYLVTARETRRRHWVQAIAVVILLGGAAALIWSRPGGELIDKVLHSVSQTHGTSSGRG